MSKELRDKLEKDIDKASWEMLSDHHKRGAVFWAKDVDLLDVAVALATDEVSKVKLWLDSGSFLKVEDEHADEWAKEPKAKNFKFIIVQPYVVISLLN